MIHQHVSEGDSAHFGVSTDGFRKVLLQVGDIYGEQSRVALTIEEAEQFIALFSEKLAKAKVEPTLEQFVNEHRQKSLR